MICERAFLLTILSLNSLIATSGDCQLQTLKGISSCASCRQPDNKIQQQDLEIKVSCPQMQGFVWAKLKVVPLTFTLYQKS